MFCFISSDFISSLLFPAKSDILSFARVKVSLLSVLLPPITVNVYLYPFVIFSLVTLFDNLKSSL